MTSLATIQQLLIEEFGLSADQVKPGALLEELGVDTRATIEFMFFAEALLNIQMSGKPIVLKTVADIAQKLDSLIAMQGTGGR